MFCGFPSVHFSVHSSIDLHPSIYQTDCWYHGDWPTHWPNISLSIGETYNNCLLKCIKFGVSKWNRSNFRILGFIWRMHGRNCLIFGILMYPDHLQNWFDFGHGLFLFSIKAEYIWISGRSHTFVCNVVQLLSHPGISGVTLCFCNGSYAAAGRRFLFTR